MRFGRQLLALAAAAAIALIVSSASAVPIGFSSSLVWDSGTQNGNINMLARPETSCTPPPGGDKAGTCTNPGFAPPHGLFTVDGWTAEYDTDPFVRNNFTVTNTSGGTLLFDFIVVLPVVETGPQTAMSGSLGITLTNSTGSALLTDAGVPVYQAYIDGAVVRTLFPPAYSLSCSPPFCSSTDSDDFGVFPNPPEIGPQADTDIWLRIRFNLSDGASAGVTSIFNIEAVPEPATAVLVGLGLLGLAVAGRRRP